MFLIDDPSNVLTEPAPTAPGTPGWFSEGNGTSATGTKVTNDWLNAVQAELANIATAAGASLDTTKAVNNQAIAAIQALILTAQGNLSGVNTITDADHTFNPATDAGAEFALGTPTANRTWTINDGTARGQTFRFVKLGSASFSLTIQVQAGSAALFYGQGINAAASFILPNAAEVEFYWTGANWRIRYLTFALVQKTDQLPAMRSSSATGVAIGASYSHTQSFTFTAPCNGSVVAVGKLNLGGVAANNIQAALSIAGTVIEADNTPLSQAFSGCATVTAGQSVTVSIAVTTTSSPATTGTYSVTGWFIPTA